MGKLIDTTGLAYAWSKIKTLLSGKVDKVDGKSLISDTEITRLASVSNYDDTSVKSSIATNATNINNEITRAKAAEKVNADNITALQTDIDNSINSISVGTTSTVSAGTSASVKNSGTSKDVILDFSIPKGENGITPQIKIDSTTYNWLISTDGGTTWTDTGIASKQAVITDTNVVQETGQSLENVMSQKAVTDALANNVNTTDIYKAMSGLSYLIYENIDGTITKEVVTTQITPSWKFANNTTVKNIYAMPDMSKWTSLLSFANSAANLVNVYFDNISFPLLTDASYSFDTDSNIELISFKNCTFATLKTLNLGMNIARYKTNAVLDLTKCSMPALTDISNIAHNCGFRTIKGVLDCTNVTAAGSIFGDALINLTNFEGLGNIKVSYKIRVSTLTHDSLVSMIANLADMTTTDNQTWCTNNSLTTTPTLTLGSTNLAKLTDAEKKVATDKGWILA